MNIEDVQGLSVPLNLAVLHPAVDREKLVPVGLEPQSAEVAPLVRENRVFADDAMAAPDSAEIPVCSSERVGDEISLPRRDSGQVRQAGLFSDVSGLIDVMGPGAPEVDLLQGDDVEIGAPDQLRNRIQLFGDELARPRTVLVSAVAAPIGDVPRRDFQYPGSAPARCRPNRSASGPKLTDASAGFGVFGSVRSPKDPSHTRTDPEQWDEALQCIRVSEAGLT